MQCSRCRTGISNSYSGSRVFKRHPRPSPRHLTDMRVPSPAPGGSNLDEFPFEAVEDSLELGSTGFFRSYQSSLIIASVAAVFCASVLWFVGTSVTTLGIAAVPFWSVFSVGLLVSVGLPFKLLREHFAITRA
jgi:hypothetical protein